MNLSPALRRLDAQDARDALREEALDCLEEWFADNTVRVQYLQVRGLVTWSSPGCRLTGRVQPPSRLTGRSQPTADSLRQARRPRAAAVRLPYYTVANQMVRIWT